MKVVIADDESLVRYSLKSMFGETGIAVTVVGEATNGEELVTLVRRHLPDVAFVDIKMPKLDGLAAIEAASEYSPGTHWIILTSYSEFAYAQRAVKLGAVDYLLKPVGPEELKGALERRRLDSERERAARNEEFESRMTALLNRTIRPESVDEGESMVSYGTLVMIDTTRSAQEREALKLELCDTFRESMREGATGGRLAALVPLAGERICIVLAGAKAQRADGVAFFKRFSNRGAQIVDRFSSADAAATLLATGECESYARLATEVWRLAELGQLRAIAGVGRVLAKEELETLEADPPVRALAEALTRIADASRTRQSLILLSELEDVERLLASPDLAKRQQVLKAAARFLGSSLSVKSSAEERSPADWIAAARAEAGRRLAHREGANGDLVEQVKSYLDLRYADNLTIALLAERLHITPNYLSNLFHQRVGMTFVRYLTTRRMERARELLSSERVQIQEVARRVGYHSTRHFSRIFKAFFGIYPSDFRDEGKGSGSRDEE